MGDLKIPLDIEGLDVEGVEFTEEGEIYITVVSTIEGNRLPCCGQKISDPYGQDREITLRHYQF